MSPKSQRNRPGRWSTFPENYCEREMRCIAQTLSKLHSAVVVGGSGTGKSNLGGMLATRPEGIQPFLPKENDYLFCLADINKFPDKDEIGFYRGMLHSLYQATRREELSIAAQIRQLEKETRQYSDEYSWILALEEAHELVIIQEGKELVWLLDRFDKACPDLADSILDTLRSLRDEDLFYGRLFYLAFSRKPLQRLRDWRANSEFLEIVESHTCWVGPLSESDTRWRIQDLAKRHNKEIPEFTETMLFQLTGGLAAFVKATTEVWLKLDETEDRSPSLQAFEKQLLKHDTIRRTCKEILEDLESSERAVLMTVASGTPQLGLDQDAVDYLKNHRLLKEQSGVLHLFSPLLEAYLHEFQEEQPGIITIDGTRRDLLRDGIPMDIQLTGMEYKLAAYMVEHPNQVLTHDELIDHLWSEEDTHDRRGSLNAHIRNMRDKFRKYELDEAVVSVHGRGYRFEQLELIEE